MNVEKREFFISGFVLPTILNSFIPVSALVPFSAHVPFFIKYGYGFFIDTFFRALISYASIVDIGSFGKMSIIETK